MKIAITDVETTGLDPLKHEIISIGCVVFDSDTFEILETFDRKIKPEHPETGDKRAFEVNGYTPEAWVDELPLYPVLIEYANLTKGCMFLAHNVVFDHGFLMEAFKKEDITCRFSLYKIDLLSLAWAKIPHAKTKGWSLKAVCEALGIDPEPAVHTALNGAMKEYEVYKKLMS